MIKKVLVAGAYMVPLISLLAAYKPVGIMGDGAPASSTGAPSENTCSVSGCHDSYNLNSGSALFDLSVIPDVQEYIPGNKYTVKIKVTDSNIQRFGFQFVALKDKDQTNAGNIQIIDSARTQVIYNYLTLKDRQYATYTYFGSEAVTNGKGEWTFDWIAPNKSAGAISFYAAVSSANNDGTDKGDYIFTKSMKLGEGSALGIREQKNKNNFNLSLSSNPNPATLIADFFLEDPSNVELMIYDLSGKKQMILINKSFSTGTHHLTFDMDKKLTAGIYIVRLKIKEQSTFRKIAIQ